MVEKKEDNNDLAFEIQKLDSSESEDENNEVMNTPDEQLMNMQKQRSIPPVVICEFSEGDNEEKVHLEVDGDKMGDLMDSPLLIGMMSAGGEEKMFRRYSQESPLLKAPGKKLGGTSYNNSTGASANSMGSAGSKE
jgi:hypothetical protein